MVTSLSVRLGWRCQSLSELFLAPGSPPPPPRKFVLWNLFQISAELLDKLYTSCFCPSDYVGTRYHTILKISFMVQAGCCVSVDSHLYFQFRELYRVLITIRKRWKSRVFDVYKKLNGLIGLNPTMAHGTAYVTFEKPIKASIKKTCSCHE